MRSMKSIPVFYRPEQVADSECFSPSASKPEKVVESWLSKNFPIDIQSFEPATTEQLVRAHAPHYVEGVLSSMAVNGFGNRSKAIAKSLPFTSGSFLAAAWHAFLNGGVAVSPTSGFHHAEYSGGMGYCTFNGLMVTALDLLLAENGPTQVAILDIDAHYGNGTEDIIRTSCESSLIKKGDVLHWTFGKWEHAIREKQGTAEVWINDLLPGILENLSSAGIILYQAGADPHIDDPMGGNLTTSQMRRRDKIVFEFCAAKGIPVVWNLAGGYQEPIERVLELHDNTMRECAAAYINWAARISAIVGRHEA